MYLQQRAAIALQKRDNNGYALPPWLIIFLIILGSGFLVCCGYAVFRFYGDNSDPNQWAERSAAQDTYMLEVRKRNIRNLAIPLQGKRNFPRQPYQNMAHAPMSPR